LVYTFELANQNAQKALLTCVVYTKLAIRFLAFDFYEVIVDEAEGICDICKKWLEVQHRKKKTFVFKSTLN